MRDTLDVLKTRRSCRKYEDRQVPDEIVEKIVEAGTYAATGMGRQSPVILVVKDRKIRIKVDNIKSFSDLELENIEVKSE